MALKSKEIALVVVIVVIFIGTTFGSFLLYQAMSYKDPFPYGHKHTYSFEGTLNGSECTGEGHSKYVSESKTEHFYKVYYSLSGSSQISSDFDLIFDLDEIMEPSDVYINGGMGSFEGKEAHIWTASINGMDYTFYVGTHCVLFGVHMTSDELDVIGTMVE